MALTIPLFNDRASQSEEVTLDGIPYRFQFDYNSRCDAWFMQILNRDLETLAAGIKIVTKIELISQFVGRGLPPGELFIIDATDEQIRVHRNNIGLEPDGNELPLQLVYLDKDEVTQIDEFIEVNT